MIKKILDSKREALSALIDGEASELEIHKLVREFHSDESLISSCVRYQDVGSILRGNNNVLSEEDNKHLYARITKAVKNEEIYSKGSDLSLVSTCYQELYQKVKSVSPSLIEELKSRKRKHRAISKAKRLRLNKKRSEHLYSI